MENESLYNFDDGGTNVSELDDIISADEILSGLEDDTAVVDSDDFIKKENEVEVLSEEIVSSENEDSADNNKNVSGEASEQSNTTVEIKSDGEPTPDVMGGEETILTTDEPIIEEEEVLLDSDDNKNLPIGEKIVVDEETENLVKTKIQQHQDLLGNEIESPDGEAAEISSDVVEETLEVANDDALDNTKVEESETDAETLDTIDVDSVEPEVESNSAEEILVGSDAIDEIGQVLTDDSELVSELGETVVSQANSADDSAETIASESENSLNENNQLDSNDRVVNKEEESVENSQSDEIDITIEDEKDEKSFFDEELEDESISLSKDELSDILEDKSTEVDKKTELDEIVPTVETVVSANPTEGTNEELQEEHVPEPEADILNNTVEFDESESEDIISSNISEENGLTEETDMTTDSMVDKEEKVLEETNEIDELEAKSGSDLQDKGIDESKSAEILPVENEQDSSISAEQVGGSFFDEDEDESISLTGNELDNILQTTEVVEEEADLSDTGSEADLNLEAGETANVIESEVLKDVNKLEPETATTHEEVAEESKSEIFDDGTIDADEIAGSDIKKILKYLDELLDKLPEDEIKKFAESKYYDLYVDLLDKLGI